MSPSIRAAGICGMLFAITFAVGGILLGELFGSFADSDETFIEYYESTSNQNGSAVGGVFLFVSGIVLLPFFGGLLDVMHRKQTSSAAGFVMPLTYVGAGLIIASAAALSTVGFARAFADITDESTPPFQGSSIAVLPQLGYVLMVFAAWVLAAVLAVIASVSMRNRTLPRAISWLTVASAALLILAPSGIALFVLPAWSLAIAVFMLRSGNAGVQ